MRAVFVTLILLTFSLSVAAQQIYRWVDESGTVHFTDAPPEDHADVERRTLAGGDRVVTAPEPIADAVSDDEIDALYSPEQRQQACEQARANRTTLRNMAVVMQDLDGDGTPDELDDEQRAAALERAETQVRLLCLDEGP